MRQGWKLVPLCAALALACTVAAPATQAATPKSAAAKSSPDDSESRAKNALRQFTGVVTHLDAGSITVQKGGKQPKTMVFAKHEGMKTTGEVRKDARVTVFYRLNGDRAVAHRVVVKPKKTGSGRSR